MSHHMACSQMVVPVVQPLALDRYGIAPKAHVIRARQDVTPRGSGPTTACLQQGTELSPALARDKLMRDWLNAYRPGDVNAVPAVSGPTDNASR